MLSSFELKELSHVSENPYASPLETNAPPAPLPLRESMKVASGGKRFANLLIDNIIIQVLSAGAGFLLGMAYVSSKAAANEVLTDDDEATLNIIGFALGIGIAVGYFAITEALFQRTLAKFVTGTIVVSSSGERPSFGQIVGRSFARLIPFEAFSFLGNSNPVGWHDSLSGTRVIDNR
jgi:uncharacterized RDD family membrane protein YckC